MRDVIEIETKRLKLRALRMSDAQRIAQLCGDPGVARISCATPLPYLEVAAEGCIMTLAARKPLGRRLRVRGRAAGRRPDRHDRRAQSAAMTASRSAIGSGVRTGARASRTEALQRVLDAKRRSSARLQAGHFVDNPASGRVLEKAGFAYTGETEDLFSLARGESAPVKRMRYAPAERTRAAVSGSGGLNGRARGHGRKRIGPPSSAWR